MLATAIACVAIIYFSIPMSDTQQSQFDVILVLGNNNSSHRLPDCSYSIEAGIAPADDRVQRRTSLSQGRGRQSQGVPVGTVLLKAN